MAPLSQYLKDTRAELALVKWPSREQTAAYAVVVVAISLFCAAYLGAFDYIFTRALSNVASHAPALQSSGNAAAASTSPITVSTSTAIQLSTSTLK